MRHLTRALALAAGTLAPLCAQTTFVVVPPAQTSAPGNSFDVEPFGYDQVRHVQYADRSLVSGLTNRVLREIAYRRDDAALRTSTMRRTGRRGSTTPVWQVRLGNVSTAWNRPPTTFPTASQAGWSTVFSPRRVSFPDLPPVTGTVAPFDLKFPFDAPFTFLGPNLGIDHFAFETTNNAFGAYLMDAVTTTSTGGSVDRIAPDAVGCPPGANRATGLAPNPGGGALELFLYGAPSGTNAWINIGASATSWGGLRLPLDLAPIGLPGCKVYTDWSLSFPTSTTGAGTAVARLPVPRDPNLRGVDVYAQWAVGDTRVSQVLPIATSDGLRCTLGSDLGEDVVPMSVVSGVGFIARGRVGWVGLGRGPIFRLGY